MARPVEGRVDRRERLLVLVVVGDRARLAASVVSNVVAQASAVLAIARRAAALRPRAAATVVAPRLDRDLPAAVVAECLGRVHVSKVGPSCSGYEREMSRC